MIDVIGGLFDVIQSINRPNGRTGGSVQFDIKKTNGLCAVQAIPRREIFGRPVPLMIHIPILRVHSEGEAGLRIGIRGIGRWLRIFPAQQMDQVLRVLSRILIRRTKGRKLFKCPIQEISCHLGASERCLRLVHV